MSFFPTKILLGLDGSREARAAARTATELAEKTGSELHVVHALSTTPRMPYPSPYAMEREEASLEEAKRHGREFLESQVKEIEGSGVKVAGAHFRLGEPDAEIVETAEEIGAGLIVVGSRGLGGVRRALMGSVSDSVVRHAHCPVLVVREEESE